MAMITKQDMLTDLLYYCTLPPSASLTYFGQKQLLNVTAALPLAHDDTVATNTNDAVIKMLPSNGNYPLLVAG